MITVIEPTVKVDILLATYNGGRFLAEQLASIERQTFSEWRLIARDDGSTDNTILILEEFRERYPDKILLIEDEEDNLGPSQNFERLLAYSDAPYFFFCDQDDVWIDNKVAVMLDLIISAEAEENSDRAIFAHSDLTIVDSELKVIAPSMWQYQYMEPSRCEWNHLVVQNVVTGCAAMGNASLRRKIVPFPKEIIMHDWWIALVASVIGRIVWTKECTVMYRQHSKNDTGAKHWSLIHVFATIVRILRSPSLRKIVRSYQAQAEALHKRYASCISPVDREGLSAFASFESRSYFYRFVIVLRYRIFKTGFLRNLALLLRI